MLRTKLQVTRQSPVTMTSARTADEICGYLISRIYAKFAKIRCTRKIIVLQYSGLRHWWSYATWVTDLRSTLVAGGGFPRLPDMFPVVQPIEWRSSTRRCVAKMGGTTCGRPGIYNRTVDRERCENEIVGVCTSLQLQLSHVTDRQTDGRTAMKRLGPTAE